MMPTGISSYRAPFMGTTHVVTSNDYHASAAGRGILEEGGNAVDAGVATGLAINVTMPQMTNLGGVAPIIMYLADSAEVLTVSGLGRWPRGATLQAHIERYGHEIPQGMASVVVPSAADAWLTALERYGTMSFEQVVAPALELAERGFPYTHSMLRMATLFEDFLEDWPANGDMFMPGGAHRPGRRPVHPEGAGRNLSTNDSGRAVRRVPWPSGRGQGGPRLFLPGRHRPGDRQVLPGERRVPHRRGPRRFPREGRAATTRQLQGPRHLYLRLLVSGPGADPGPAHPRGD